MSYAQGFVVAVKNNKNEVLRENRNKEVFLPFESEYSIRLKNDNARKATVSVEIDGTDVLGGHELILNAWGSMDLDRFCIDGDLTKGNKLKFVKSTDSQVQDPTSPLNGRVKVTFRLEKEKEQIYVPYQAYPGPYWNDNHQNWGCYSKGTSDIRSVKTMTMDWSSQTLCSAQETGATVEGSASDQRFVMGSVGELETGSTEIILWLRPAKEHVTVKDTRHIYCSQCGKKMLYQAKFCSDCGNNLKA